MCPGALSCSLRTSEDRSIAHEWSGCLAWQTRTYLTCDDASMYARIGVAILGLRIQKSIDGLPILGVLHSCHGLVAFIISQTPMPHLCFTYASPLPY